MSWLTAADVSSSADAWAPAPNANRTATAGTNFFMVASVVDWV